ncbi:hypothetical protein HYO43_07745 [Vibrio parahaemolyticus]|nr:hypothetical protein [Vibrio parahaemolyticus]
MSKYLEKPENFEQLSIDDLRGLEVEVKALLSDIANKIDQKLALQKKNDIDDIYELAKERGLSLEDLAPKFGVKLNEQTSEEKAKTTRNKKANGNYYYYVDESNQSHLLNTTAPRKILKDDLWRGLVESTVINGDEHVSGIQDYLITHYKEIDGSFTYWTKKTLDGKSKPDDKDAIETKFNGLKIETIKQLQNEIRESV